MNSMKWFVSLVFVTFFAISSSAQDVSGVMMVVKGDIKVTDKAGKTEAAKVGKKVFPGDTVVAGADSRAKIVMSDKNVINVSPDSKVTIEKYENDGKDKKNVELSVAYGKIRANVEQKYDGEKSKFNIKTPSAVAGVRGTDFLAGYNPASRSTQVVTFSGAVAVGQLGPGGTIRNPVFVHPGQMTQVGQGKAPEIPQAVPKEELNKLNGESKAEALSNPHVESQEKSASNNKEEGDAKEDKGGDKAADKSADKNDKSADKKGDSNGDKSADKRAEPAADHSADQKSDQSTDHSSDKKQADARRDSSGDSGSKEVPRDPASTASASTSGSTSGTTNAGPAPASTSTATAAPPPSIGLPPPPPPPPMPMPTMVFIPPPLPPPVPVPSTLINSVIKSTQRSATTIRICTPSQPCQ